MRIRALTSKTNQCWGGNNPSLFHVSLSAELAVIIFYFYFFVNLSFGDLAFFFFWKLDTSTKRNVSVSEVTSNSLGSVQNICARCHTLTPALFENSASLRYIYLYPFFSFFCAKKYIPGSVPPSQLLDDFSHASKFSPLRHCCYGTFLYIFFLIPVYSSLTLQWLMDKPTRFV